MNEPLLRLTGVTKRFGGFVALNQIDLIVRQGERIGLLGPNGSGKSTLVDCISGVQRNDGGSIQFEGREISQLAAYRRARLGLARSFQLPKPFVSMSVMDNLLVPMLYATNRHSDSPRHRIVEETMEILRLVGLAEKAAARSAGLTQVDMRKLELARALAAKPKLLIADEAMAGLSSAEVDEIVQLLFCLREQDIAVIMIEHIMRTVMRFSERIVVIVAGRKIADGDPESVVADREVIGAYLGE
jgi:branched-chain amino acid transport system ATP-binding protein